MSGRQEKVEALLADVLPRIEEIKAESLSRIDSAERDAWDKISRHAAATNDLAEVEAEIEDLLEEKAGLPLLHSQAVVDDDVEAELAVKDRAQVIRTRIGELETRRDELWKEIGGLLPNAKNALREPHRHDADIEHTSRAAGVAHKERGPLEHLRDRLVEASNGAAEPVVKRHEENRAQVQAWARTREWEQSPAARGAIQS